MHKWIGSIAEAVSGHADDLEEASSDFARMHAELIAYERKIVDVLQGTETKIGEAFAKIDSLIGQLRKVSCAHSRPLGVTVRGTLVD